MPWLGDDFGMKDPQGLPGLSLVQWMNMQQSSSLANSMQPNYLQSFSGSVLQNLAGADLSRQLGGLPGQVPQHNNLQFNGQRPGQQPQHLEQLQKLPAASLNPLGSIIQPQQQLTDLAQQQRQNLMNQTLPTSQVQAQLLQANLVQSQNVLQQQQASHQLQRNLSQNLQSPQSQPQQQILSQNQQQNLMASQSNDPISQQFNMPENQIQLQLLQKLHQQQQSFLAQQSALQQPPQLTPIHDQQKPLLDVPQSFSRSMTSSQILDASQTISTSLPQSHVSPQQMTRTGSQNNLRFNQPPLQGKPHQQQQQPGVLPELHGHVGHTLTPTNQLSAAGSSLITGAAGGGHSAITDDIPSCSTSPSTNNCPNVVQPIMNGRTHRSAPMGDEITQPSATLLSSSGLETVSASSNLVKDMMQKPEVKPSLNVSKSQNQGFFAHQTFLNTSGAQIDYLDSSSSATSVCLSQNDVHLQQNTNQMSFNSQPVLFRDTSQEDVHADPRTNISFGANMDNQLGMPMMSDPVITKGMMGSGKDFSNNLASEGGMLSSFENPKESQPELSSSMVSGSFGVPDMAFNSIDSAINDNGFMNRNAWAPPPQLPRMRTYTKVSSCIFYCCKWDCVGFLYILYTPSFLLLTL